MGQRGSDKTKMEKNAEAVLYETLCAESGANQPSKSVQTNSNI